MAIKESSIMKRNTTMQIGERLIGKCHYPLVIAEVGINHEGSFTKAMQMIDDAKKAGCECVKFQCHVIDDEMIQLASEIVPANANESIWEIMSRCQLSEGEDRKLKDYVESQGMLYLSTPFSRAAADRLQAMGVLAYKIGSGECNNYPLIEHIARFGKPVILSTGMNDINSIKRSVEILEGHNVPFALLHCTSLYPTPYNRVRLRALEQMEKEFPGIVLGLSDHSFGNYTCFAAVTLGAAILEKHFTSDKNWPGPDIPISIDPQELKDLVFGSACIHDALNGKKEILPEEQPTIDFAYASVVSIRPISKGDVFSKENVWVKRPGKGGFLASEYETILGKCATQDIECDQQIIEGMIDG